MQRLAVLDLGTNTFHLLIVEVKREGYSVLFKEKIAVKLGEGGISKGIITDEAADRAIDTLRYFKEKADLWNAATLLATATSAIRNASNGHTLVQRIREEVGMDIRVISGEEEAEYICKGVKSALTLGDSPSLIMDIGGGSVEFILTNDKKIFWKKSYEIGAQRLMDKFHRNDPILQVELDALYTYLAEVLIELREQIQLHNPQVLIGSSGTFDTLSDIYCQKHSLPKDINNPEGPLTILGFEEIFMEIKMKDRIERLAIPGMLAMRVDMIVVACALIDFLLKTHGFTEIRVSAYALKEGVLTEAIQLLNEKGQNISPAPLWAL
jgi:exopolyphosphatase / guanosine-5'-triphosphate,3'-diphosphate pyrophosphatase